MSTGKQMVDQHIIDNGAQQLLKSILPKHWVLREYKPDYGIDYALEIFGTHSDQEKMKYETLGEHIFIQLKGTRNAKRQQLRIHSRSNVEKASHKETATKQIAEIETLPVQIEISELVTVQRMGSSMPVLLVRADLNAGRCYFVCLNDYIEKVLAPSYDDYTEADSRVIQIPAANDLRDPTICNRAMRWYGKRAKLFAAFQKFVYQNGELDYARDATERNALARYFARLIVQYDFWDDTEMWPIISHYGEALRSFVKTGVAGLLKINTDGVDSASHGVGIAAKELVESLRDHEVVALWRGLAALTRNYEEICKEWFLPTSLGLAHS